MSRLITTTGIEIPTFSPALGPESAQKKVAKKAAPAPAPAPAAKNKQDLEKMNELIRRQFSYDPSFGAYYSPMSMYRYQPFLGSPFLNSQFSDPFFGF